MEFDKLVERIMKSTPDEAEALGKEVARTLPFDEALQHMIDLEIISEILKQRREETRKILAVLLEEKKSNENRR